MSNNINDFTPSSSPPGSPPNAKKRRKNRDAYFADKLGPEISTKKGDPGNSGFEDASTSQTDIHNQMRSSMFEWNLDQGPL